VQNLKNPKFTTQTRKIENWLPEPEKLKIRYPNPKNQKLSTRTRKNSKSEPVPSLVQVYIQVTLETPFFYIFALLWVDSLSALMNYLSQLVFASYIFDLTCKIVQTKSNFLFNFEKSIWNAFSHWNYALFFIYICINISLITKNNIIWLVININNPIDLFFKILLPKNNWSQLTNTDVCPAYISIWTRVGAASLQRGWKNRYSMTKFNGRTIEVTVFLASKSNFCKKPYFMCFDVGKKQTIEYTWFLPSLSTSTFDFLIYVT